MRRRGMLLMLLLAFTLVSARAGAQSPPPDDSLVGQYRGFAQSALNAELRMPMALLVDRSEGSEFFGSLTLGPMPFTFSGKIDDAGHFKGRGTGPAGEVTFNGTAQGFATGGVLARATYKFTPATGARADQGVADFIRAPHLPPHALVPLGGMYQGTHASGGGGGEGKVDVHGFQVGTWFTGEIFWDVGTPKALSWEFVAGIQPCILGTVRCTPEIVLIAVGAAGRLLAGGAWVPPPDDGAPLTVKLTYFLEFLGGGVDLGTMKATRPAETR